MNDVQVGKALTEVFFRYHCISLFFEIFFFQAAVLSMWLHILGTQNVQRKS